jgi:hypothetical protein
VALYALPWLNPGLPERVRERPAKVLRPDSTTRFERVLLALMIILLPTQDCDMCNSYNPVVKVFGSGVSASGLGPNLTWMFTLFAMAACYIVLNRSRVLARTWNHPVFLAAYAFLLLSLLLESTQSNSSYRDLGRIAQMLLGGVMIAVLCRDRRALRTAIAGYIIMGMWISVYVFLIAYGTLSGAELMNFEEASLVRGEVFSDNPFQANLNGMAFMSGQGALAALVLALAARAAQRRYLFLGISLFCFVAAFLPLSRSGAAIVVVSTGAVVIASKVRFGKLFFVGCAFAIAIIALVPDAVWRRMTFSTETYEGEGEARARIYSRFFEHIPDYGISGVGAGDFVTAWAYNNGFSNRRGVIGAHNCFFQVTIYWGLLGVFALLAVVWQAYRCLPKPGGDAMVSFLIGIAISLLLLMQVMHNVYAKEFSLGLGLLVGANRWIWPQGRGKSALSAQNRYRYDHSIQPA